jgi:hypothetical protein
MLGDRRDEWLAARLEDLDYGDINGIEAAVREYRLEGTKKDEAGKELGYFLNNAKAAKTHTWRPQVAPARHQAVAACATCPGPGGRSGEVTSPTGGSVSAAMHAVSSRRI